MALLLSFLAASVPLYARDCKPNAHMARQIARTAIKHNLPPKLLYSIAATESCFGRHRFNAKGQDYGLMQINWRTIKANHLDSVRLLYDDEYALNVAAQILQHNRAKWPTNWQCRYHSSKPILCSNYLHKLSQYGYFVSN